MEEQGNAEPRFVVETELNFSESRPELILFRIASKRQIGSNPDKFYMSVEEFLESEAAWSPLFVLKADAAVDLAKNLLNVAHDSQIASETS